MERVSQSELWMKDPVALRRNRGTDPVFFARSVFPDAAIEDLATAVIWISWLYFWDDALDFGDLDNKTGRMSQYREETLSCIQHSLLNDGLNEDKDPVHIAPTCLAAQAWHSIGVHIQHRVTAPSSRKYMHDCLRDYVAATIELQTHCDKAEILDIDSYLAIRMRTSGVYPTISLYLLTSRSEPPDWLFSHRLVQAALIEMNRIVSIYNDIVSAHLEIESGHIDNIIPLLMHHKSLSAQGAVDEAVQMIQDSYAAFRCLEAQITTLGREQDIVHEVSAFLKGCVNLCMGALQWTSVFPKSFILSMEISI
ncbi:hypothetical protein N7476_005077 [Penicillium atrosanguineum]|uniref:Terpene synthase n=1 Tax=Penicillium atrosanguineum TaxID=1132637 RepID=A0A9W9U7A4_9EURO|nr:hypothetical protein N7526_002017 [Penicillium atrosanguineum]KAJ5318657.1 hypothetical protein N7476_005077 [Penicillium atrosanguineum]